MAAAVAAVSWRAAECGKVAPGTPDLKAQVGGRCSQPSGIRGVGRPGRITGLHIIIIIIIIILSLSLSLSQFRYSISHFAVDMTSATQQVLKLQRQASALWH